MIKDILSLLRFRDYYGESEFIDIAKGYYKVPNNYKDAFEQFKRDLKWQK